MLWKVRIGGTFFIALVFTLVILSISIVLFSADENYSEVFHAEEGVLELSSTDFKYNIILDGQWKYWDKQLISREQEASESFSLVTIPHKWNGRGYGTYSLKLKGLSPGECYSLYVPDTTSAFSLYIDASPAARNGTVGTDAESEELHWEPLIVNFTANKDEIEVMIQISNFNSFPGGFTRNVKLGLPKNVLNEKTKNISEQMILFGGILIIAFYNLCLFLLNTKDKAALYFALFNFILAARIPLIGERLINVWLADANWVTLLKLQFFFGASMLGLFALFMNSLFRDAFNKTFMRIVLGIAVALGLAAFIIPMQNLAPADMIFLGTSLIYFIYLIIVLLKGIRKKLQGSIFAFIGITFILGSIILDLILPPGSNIIPVGMFIFIIFESLVIGEKHSFIMEQNKHLHNVAIRDGMTNLYKKDHFQKLISSIIEEDAQLSRHGMMFLDIDNFKTINDTYGHDTGDELIIIVADKILHSLRYSDIASRFGGDEFIIWLHNTSRHEAEIIAQRILDEITEPIVIGENKIITSLSIGLSFFPEDGEGIDPLLSICDKRMYDAKKNGKNQFISC